MGNNGQPCGRTQTCGRESIPSWRRVRRWQRYRADGCWMMRPKMKIAVLQQAKRCRVCGCAQAQMMRPMALEQWHRCTMFTGYPTGGDCRGGVASRHVCVGDAMTPMCDQGFGPLTEGPPAPARGSRRSTSANGRRLRRCIWPESHGGPWSRHCRPTITLNTRRWTIT
jgi:hypothetical protein